MKGILIITFFFLCFQSFSAEEKASITKAEVKHERIEEAYIKEGIPIPIYISFKSDRLASVTEFWEEFREIYQLSKNYSFKKEREESDQFGFSHIFYREYFNERKILPAQVHLKIKGNKVVSFNGKAYRQIKSGKSVISENKALQLALNDINAFNYKWEIKEEEEHLKQLSQNSKSTYFPKGELVYYGIGASAKQEDLRLCYKFNIYANNPLGRYNYFIDATSGEILFIENLLHSSDTPGQAHTAYSGTKTIMTDSVGTFFRLVESGRGNGIETYDLNNSTTYSSAVDFIDSNNIWDVFNPPIDRYATDAHWGTEQTYDYFLNEHNRNSIDGQGFTLRSYVHYGSSYANAFWDGQRMTYGDGNSTINPLTTLDITGHEITHGLTNFTSQLVYAKESGALNESFSDIFGVAVDHYARNGQWNWLMGDELGNAFRSMSNPNQFGDPDTYTGINWISQNCNPTNTNDWCGVHTNSGVQNYWFYLLSEGGSGTNDIGNPFSVDSIGINKAAKVAFRNNTIYLTSSSDYEEARFFSIVSAADIFGPCSFEVEAVTNAWHAVGVGSRYVAGVNADFVALNDTSFCSLPAIVDFKSETNNVLTYRWDFGDGLTSSQLNPTHIYTNYGSYTVSLIGDGGQCGNDTAIYSSYIIIDSTNICTSIQDSSFTEVLECRGTIHDRGGLNGDYELNSKDTILISPLDGDLVTAYFDVFDVESGFKGNCNHDYIEVFDGPSTLDKSLGRFCNANPPPDSIVSTGSSLLIILSSDDKVTRNGYSISWKCDTAVTLPWVDFRSNIDTTCNGKVQFINLSEMGGSNYSWDFGDGNKSTLKNPSHRYNTNGVYSVKLIVENSQGKDSLIKQNVVSVVNPPAPLVGNDTSCIGNDAKLWARGNSDLLWYRGLNEESAFHNSDTLFLNSLSQTEEYYVSSSPSNNSLAVTPFNFSGAGYYSDSTESIYFDVHEPIVIDYFVFKSNRRGNREIVVRDSSGGVVASQQYSVTNSIIQIVTDIEIDPGNNYSLTIGSRNPSLYVNTSGASYPYSVSNLIDVTGSSMGTNAFPFFYYMNVSQQRCESERVRVEAFVDTSCVLTKNTESSLIESRITLYPNPVSEQLFISGLERKLEAINIFNSNGKLLRQIVNSLSGNFKSEITINTSSLTLGVYFLELRFSDGSTKRTKFIKMKP